MYKYLNTASFMLHMQTCRRYEVFLKDAQSIENLVEIFNTFSLFSGLKPNLTKCEIVETGVLKGVQVAACGMRCVYLCNEAIKNLVTYFSYNSRIKEEC